MGIYKALDIKREELAISMGLIKMLGDTHEGNVHRLDIAKKAGYKFVDYKFYRDHFNVVMVKWLDSCPYSEIRFKYEFAKRKATVKIKRLLKKILMK